MRTTVKVENLKIYAFHGCMNEEKVIGSDYVVNITAICFVNNESDDSGEIRRNTK